MAGDLKNTQQKQSNDQKKGGSGNPQNIKQGGESSKDGGNQGQKQGNQQQQKNPDQQRNQHGGRGSGRGGRGGGGRGGGGGNFFNRDTNVNRGGGRFNWNDGGNMSFNESYNSRDDTRGEDTGPKEEKKFTGRCRLFVGNLPNETEDEDFKKMFLEYGDVSEVYLNKQKGFGFIRLDTRPNAEAAKAALDGTVRKGRTLRVRFATHGAALKIRHLSPHISNEFLESAFSKFGQVERAIVIVDDRGRSTGEGIVEFARKPGAQKAMQSINEGIFLLTTSPKPIIVEPLEQKDEDDGLPERFQNKNQAFMKEREIGPRFANPGSFEYEYGIQWKQLYELEVKEKERLQKEMDDAVEKLEIEMVKAMHDQQAEILREELRRLEELKEREVSRSRDRLNRRQEDERRRQETEERQRQEIRMRQQQKEEEMMRRRNMNNVGRNMGGDEMMGQGPSVSEDGMRGQRNFDNEREMGFRGMGGPGGPRGDMGGPVGDMGGPRGDMGGPGGQMDNAPPMQPPPAPPAGLGLNRERNNQDGGMSGGSGNNMSMSGGGPGGNNMGGGRGGDGMRQSRFDQGPSNLGNRGGMNGGNRGNAMGGGRGGSQMGGPIMGGNMGRGGMGMGMPRINRIMDRRGMREEYHDPAKRPRRF